MSSVLGHIVLGSAKLGISDIESTMNSNAIDILRRMQDSFPHIYDVYNKNSILYTLLSIYATKYGMRTDIMDRLYAMVGVDSTYDEDLEWRWGSLLGVRRRVDESPDEYRNRLKVIYPSMSGGTANAIKYAIASAAGVKSDIDEYVHVYDAWQCPYDIDMKLLGIDNVVDETSLYGNIICALDLSAANVIDHNNITNAIRQTKASGINSYLIFLYNDEEHIILSRDADEHHDTMVRDLLESTGIYNMNATAIFGMAVFGNAVFGNATAVIDRHINVDAITDNVVMGNVDDNISLRVLDTFSDSIKYI